MSPATIPDTFSAYVAESFGDAFEKIKLRTVPQASVEPTQVRIKIHSAALNPADYKIVEMGKGYLPTPTKENPIRLGFDLAGTLVEVGVDVTKFKVDDEVVAMAFFGETGSFAEYIVLEMKYLALKPKNVSFSDAAGLPVVGQTSYQALVTYGKLKKGDRVLILGGSSGTGCLAIQIAKALGAAHVIATTSSRNAEFVKSLGADQVIDYTKENYGDVLEAHSIDLIYDCGFEGASYNDAGQKVLKKDTGIFVTIDPYVKANESAIGTTFHAIRTGAGSDDLVELVKLVEAGQITIPIDSVHQFEKFFDALKVQKTNHARGKIILQVLPEAAE